MDSAKGLGRPFVSDLSAVSRVARPGRAATRRPARGWPSRRTARPATQFTTYDRAMHPADRLDISIETSGSVAVVGLDPRPDLMPPAVRERALETRCGVEAVLEAFREFNSGVVEAVQGLCAAVKLQAACYEAYGSLGWAVLEHTARIAAEHGLPVIVDAKRGDIGSTAEHYREAFSSGGSDFEGKPVGGMKADWLTVSGFLGRDSIKPFMGSPTASGLGIFVLVRTSNPSSDDVQSLKASGSTVSLHLADLVSDLGRAHLGSCGLSSVGAVVGATRPREAVELRQRMPEAMFLVPGYGAQGARAADAIAGRRADGRGIVVNSSRGILGAWQLAPGSDWRMATREALREMNLDLSAAA